MRYYCPFSDMKLDTVRQMNNESGIMLKKTMLILSSLNQAVKLFYRDVRGIQ